MPVNKQETVRPATNTRPQQEISRLLTAAVINAHFRQILLNNPANAIAMGYEGEAFHLGSEEKKSLSAIQATSLADFASQIAKV